MELSFGLQSSFFSSSFSSPRLHRELSTHLLACLETLLVVI